MNPLVKKLIERQNKLVPNSSMVADELSSKVKMWIPTGSYIADTTISNDYEGGWPCGRVIELFGLESIGKSSLCYQALANTQKMGGVAMFFDVEQAGAFEMMKSCGVDTSDLIYNNSNSIEEIFSIIEDNLKVIESEKSMKDKPVLAVIDSIAALTTDAEIEAGYENNMNLGGLKPKQLGKALRKITPFLVKTNCCLIMTNQTRQKIGIAFGDPEYQPGGKAKDFFASLRVKMLGRKPIEEQSDLLTPEEYKKIVQEWKDNGKKGEKPKKPKGEKITIGNEITLKFIKNKVGIPYRETVIELIFLEGIQEHNTILTFCKENGLVESSGAWLKWKIQDKDFPIPYDTAFQAKEFSSFMKDSDIYDSLKHKIQNMLVRTKANLLPTDDDEEPELD